MQFQTDCHKSQNHCLCSLPNALWKFRSPRGWAHSSRSNLWRLSVGDCVRYADAYDACVSNRLGMPPRSGGKCFQQFMSYMFFPDPGACIHFLRRVFDLPWWLITELTICIWIWDSRPSMWNVVNWNDDNISYRQASGCSGFLLAGWYSPLVL